MPDITAAEALPKVIIQENAPATPAKGSAEELAKKVSEKLNEGEWRKAIELRKKGNISEGEISGKIEQIGINRDAATGIKDRGTGTDLTTENGRYTQAKAAAELAKDYIEKGYDTLGTPLQDKLRKRILDDLKSRPSLSTEMTGLTAAQEQALAERILRDPSYADAAQTILKGILEMPAIDETSITAALNAQEDAKIDSDTAKADLDNDIGIRITNHKKLISQYARDASGVPTTTATLATEMDALKTSKPTLQSELALHSGQAAAHQRKLDALTMEYQSSQKKGWTGRATADVLVDIGPTTTDLQRSQEEAAKRQASLTRLSELQTEEQTLEQKTMELETERRGKDATYQKAKLEFDRRTRILEDLKSIRASQERDLVDGLDKVFESSTDAWVENQIKEATILLDADLAKIKETSTDNNEKAMVDALREVWLGPERTRKKGFGPFSRTEHYRPINKVQVDIDYRNVVGNGPEPTMRRLLATRVNLATGSNYTTAEIDSLMQNKDFVAKMQPEMVKQLFARKEKTGGFTAEDIYTIVNAPWGAGMLEKARQSNIAVQQEILASFGAGALNRHGFGERFGQLARSKPWLIALLFGIPIIALGAMTMEATSEAINQQ